MHVKGRGDVRLPDSCRMRAMTDPIDVHVPQPLSACMLTVYVTLQHTLSAPLVLRLLNEAVFLLSGAAWRSTARSAA